MRPRETLNYPTWGELRGPVTAISVALLLGAAGTIYAFQQMDSTRQEAFWGELAQAGMHLSVIAIGGLFVTAALGYVEASRQATQQHRDRQREDLRRHHEYALALLRRMRERYNDIKRVRRQLEIAGLQPTCTGPITPAAGEAYVEAMATLREVKLDLEAIQDELDAGMGGGGATARIKSSLKAVETYIDHVLIDEYRTRGTAASSAPQTIACQSLPGLLGFVAPAHVAFKDRVSHPYHEAVRLLVAEMTAAV